MCLGIDDDANSDSAGEKGRRVVIKTIIAGAQLQHALDRHQRWLDEHEDDPDVQALRTVRRAREEAIETLRAEGTDLRRQLRDRDAEADRIRRTAKAEWPGLR